MTHLEPCPFCGSDNITRSDIDMPYQCNDCGALGPDTYQGQAFTWNTRAPDSRTNAAISLLTRLLKNGRCLGLEGVNEAELDLMVELGR